MLIRPTYRQTVDVLADAGRLPWERGDRVAGSGDVAPAVNNRRVAVFDGSRNTGTNSNTVDNAGRALVAYDAALESADGDFAVAVLAMQMPYSGMPTLPVIIGQGNGTDNRWSFGLNAGKPFARVGRTIAGAVWQASKTADDVLFPLNDEEDALSWIACGAQFWLSEATVNADRVKFYGASGELASTVSGSIPGSLYTGGLLPIQIAQMAGVSEAELRPFSGALGMVRLSIGQRLTEAEWITALAGGTMPGEVARWNFDGSGADSVGSYTATLNGGAGYTMYSFAHASGSGDEVKAGGDSITYGIGASPSVVPGGYRDFCQRVLYHFYGRRTNWTGTQTTNPAPGQLDIEHEGVGDREIGSDSVTLTVPPTIRYQIAQGVYDNPGACTIFQGGTNDLNDVSAPTGATTAGYMNAAIGEWYARASVSDSDLLVVWNVIDMLTANAAEVANHNAALATHISTRQGEGKNVVLFDANAAVQTTRGLADTVHMGTANDALLGTALAATLDANLP